MSTSIKLAYFLPCYQAYLNAACLGDLDFAFLLILLGDHWKGGPVCFDYGHLCAHTQLDALSELQHG